MVYKTNPRYKAALEKLITLCRKADINISKIQRFYDGYIVSFEDFGGDAALFYATCGADAAEPEWNTMDFPWDYGGTSMLPPDVLVKLLVCMKKGCDWSYYYEPKYAEPRS